MSQSPENSLNPDLSAQELLDGEALAVDELMLNDAKVDHLQRTDPVTLSSRLAEMDATNPNQLLEAAKPLLRMMANVPTQMDQQKVTAFRDILENEIDIFFTICEHFSLKREHVLTARYCICTALDEAINQTSWGGGDEQGIGLWPKESLLSTFHKDSYGGDKLFLLTGKLAAHPSEHIDVIELIYYILELGFEGRYRYDANGKRQLEIIKGRLLSLVNSERQKTLFSLAPHWTPAQPNSKRNKWQLPLWLLIGALFLALLLQFSWYKFRLSGQASQITAQIESVGDKPFNPKPITIEKPQLARLLSPEIQAGILTLTESEGSDLITFKGDAMFASGGTSINPELAATFERIALELNKLNNNLVTVTGHSDNVPIRTARFKDNQALSQTRAQAGADLLAQYGYPRNQMTVKGAGDQSPVTANDTPVGRALNRRVEVLVVYGNGNNTPAQAQPAAIATEANSPSAATDTELTISTEGLRPIDAGDYLKQKQTP